MKRGGKTAEQLMRELESDPSFLAAKAERDQSHRAAVARNAADAAPVLAELAAAGYPVPSIAALKGLRERYDAAIPVLVSWLKRTANTDVKRDIAGALGVRWAARQVLSPLLDEFERVEDPTGEGVRWTIGWAIGAVATADALDEIVRLASDERFGRARQMLVLGLGGIKDPRAVAAARRFLRDEATVLPAITALRKLNAREASEEIRPLLSHSNPEVRKEAKKAIARFDKSARGGDQS